MDNKCRVVKLQRPYVRNKVVKNLKTLKVEDNAFLPFTSLEKHSDYLYSAKYSVLDYKHGLRWMYDKFYPLCGACSSVRKGSLYGRNLDYYYNYDISCVVKAGGNAGHYKTMGVVGAISSFTKDILEKGDYLHSDYYSLPFFLVDGINEKGLFMNTNITHLDPRSINSLNFKSTSPKLEQKENICISMLCRYVLDKFATVDEAVEYLDNYVKVYANKRMIKMGLDAHFMLGDKTKTVVLEFVENNMKVIDSTCLTNFYLDEVEFNEGGTVYTPATQDEHHNAIITNHIKPFGMGLERWNLIKANYDNIETEADMIDLMKNKLNYKNSYSTSEHPSDPYWYTEFTGENSRGTLTVASPVEDFNYIVGAAGEAFLNRSRDQGFNGTWHTTHTAIYDLDKLKLTIYDSTEDGKPHVFYLNDPVSQCQVIEDISFEDSTVCSEESFVILSNINNNVIIKDENGNIYNRSTYNDTEMKFINYNINENDQLITKLIIINLITKGITTKTI